MNVNASPLDGQNWLWPSAQLSEYPEAAGPTFAIAWFIYKSDQSAPVLLQAIMETCAASPTAFGKLDTSERPNILFTPADIAIGTCPNDGSGILLLLPHAANKHATVMPTGMILFINIISKLDHISILPRKATRKDPIKLNRIFIESNIHNTRRFSKQYAS